MAVKDQKWSYMPVTGYDITNAFTSASGNLKESVKALEDFMDFKTAQATGEAQNALAQAEDALTVNQILNEALNNSWVDNNLLSPEASKRKDRFFDEEIAETDLEEKLRHNAHSRGMAEKNHALSSARLSHDINNANRSYALELEKMLIQEQNRAEDIELKRNESNAKVNKYNAEAAATLSGTGSSSKGSKSQSSDDKPVGLKTVLDVTMDGSKIKNQYNEFVTAMATAKTPQERAIINNEFSAWLGNEVSPLYNIDPTEALRTFGSDTNSRMDEIDSNKKNLRSNLTYTYDKIKPLHNNTSWNNNITPAVNTVETLFSLNSTKSEVGEALLENYSDYIKTGNYASAYETLSVLISELNKINPSLANSVIADRVSPKEFKSKKGDTIQGYVFNSKDDAVEIFKDVEKYLGVKK